MREVIPPGHVKGTFRHASEADRALLVTFMDGFHVETGEGSRSPEDTIDRGLADRRFWVWEDDSVVAMAALSDTVSGVARVQAVYTCPDHRTRGYAGALVAELSERTLVGGHRCILYTDLSDPVSNSVYRRIGYRAVAEVLRYRFA